MKGLSRTFRRAAGALALGCALGGLFSAAPAAAQSDEDRAAARSLATQGAAAFSAGKNAEAIDLLSRAEAIVHAPTHLLVIARAQTAMGKLVVARETYLRIVREELAATAPEPFKKAQVDARTEEIALEPRIASLRIDVRGEAAKITMDGEAVPPALIGVHRPVDPGKHQLTATLAGKPPVEMTVTLADGEKKEATLDVRPPTAALGPRPDAVTAPKDEPKITEPPPPPPPAPGTSPLRVAGLAGMGLGVAGVAVGTLFLLQRGSAQSDADDVFARNHCEVGCPADVQSSVESMDSDAASKGTLAVVGLAAGGALIAGGAALFFLGHAPAAETKTGHARVEPWLSPTGGGLRGAF